MTWVIEETPENGKKIGIGRKLKRLGKTRGGSGEGEGKVNLFHPFSRPKTIQAPS